MNQRAVDSLYTCIYIYIILLDRPIIIILQRLSLIIIIIGIQDTREYMNGNKYVQDYYYY